MKRWSGLAALVLLTGMAGGANAGAQEQPMSVRAANSMIGLCPRVFSDTAGGPAEWIGEKADFLAGVQAVWRNSADRRDFICIQQSVDPVIGADGSLSSKRGGNQLVDLEMARQLMLLYRVTLKERYFNAATAVYQSLQRQQRNASGGFSWSKGEPNVMTLSDFEAEPFYAEYAHTFHHPEAFADIAKQFVLMQEHARDPKTGLLSYRWDESKQAPWADKNTGRDRGGSSAAGMASYMAALVDTIPFFPGEDAGRTQLIAILNEGASAVTRSQDGKSSVLDEAARANGTSPAACLLVYALAKGVRRGYLPERYDDAAQRAYNAIVSNFVKNGADGAVMFTGSSARDHLEDGEEPSAVGAFLLASTEIENVKNAKVGRGDNVMVDGWFNSQKRMDATGQEIYFHYKWDEESNPGYSLWGHAFRNFGARTRALYAEPTLEDLKPAQIYIIASPDNLSVNPQAHFANETDAKEIAKWVRAGGVLAIMENDPSLADQEHFNVISEKFGIHFNSVLRMHVVGRDFAMGRFYIDGKGPIFHHPHTAYVKDVCTISVKPPAVPVYRHDKDIFMAEAKYGRGTVYAMVDPWFYNEYTNGLKLPAEYENYAAGVELARWLLEQVPKNQGSGSRVQGSGSAAAQP